MKKPELQSYAVIEPKIYAYQTLGVEKHEGWTKIGEARKQTVEARIKQQTQTVGVDWELRWERPARFVDGLSFRDKDFHRYLVGQGVEQERDTKTRALKEWFKVEPGAALEHFGTFTRRGKKKTKEEEQEYTLRNEQSEAVLRTREWFASGRKAFLWNAKPRFGKTLTAYDLVRQMGFRKVLVLTNRPQVKAGWVDDFTRFIGWQTDLLFVSDNADVLKQFPGQVHSRAAYLQRLDAQAPEEDPYGMVVFESLQGLKGSRYFGGRHEKLRWMAELEWDLLIIDEAHEGAETEKADFAIERLKHRYRLHLSGTPFKQLARGDFRPEQTFTWSYVDEQEAKAAWTGEENNPYEHLPSLKMFTYQLSPMIEAEVRKGFDEEHKYAFDLMEFFATKSTGGFVHEAEVRNFLRALTTQEKYPFSTPALREELRHTIWVLNRVASVKALEKLLKEEGSVFKDYEVVIAAGDGKSLDEEDAVITEASLKRVQNAIASGRPSITLSVGQLTVGVTVPEWTGILMLNECKSPAAYFQATFRVQNPNVFEREGQVFMKREAYVFDFNPTRTLTLYEELASETVVGVEQGDDPPGVRRAKRIRKLLNFYPVIGEDEGGQMVPLDVEQVLAIPRKLKCQEVVRHGFMCDFLFRNITGLFRNPGVYESILNKLPEADDFHSNKRQPEEVELGGIEVDETGAVTVPEETVIGTAKDLFGDKVYGTEVALPPPGVGETELSAQQFVEAAMEPVKDAVAVATQGMKPAVGKTIERRMKQELEDVVDAIGNECEHAVADATLAHEAALEAASDEAEREALEHRYQDQMEAIKEAYHEKAETAVQRFVQDVPTEVTRMVLTAQAEERKKNAEDRVRDHLRGFARTIPSFLMAYGDRELRLANFDRYVEAEVFREVTGITLEEFRLLRDGGELNGERVEGGVFDETVFDDSVQEFLSKKAELADYFNEAHTEDIFDYIPPQRTNQIFTPRKVVVRMVDALEEENPGSFDDPEHTFADLYVKSGLYLAEIAKRLFRSPAMKVAFPDDRARLEHIFTKQLYAMAPTPIIHRIVLAYLLDFDPALREKAQRRIVCADAAAAAQAGTLPQLVEEQFG